MLVETAMIHALTLLLCTFVQDAKAPPPSSLKLVASIELPKVEGRIDHLAIDRKRQHLFVAALANNTLEVVDVAAGKHVQSVAGLAEPQGVVYLEEWDRVLVSNGKSGMLEAFDASTMEKTNSAKIGDDADNVRFEPKQKLVIVGFGEGGLAIVDVKAKSVSGRIALDAHPESFQIDSTGTTAWVNVPNKSAIEIIDVAQKKVSGRIEITTAKKNYPMALVESDARLLVGCREPARLLVIDTKAARPVSDVRISGDVDDLYVDSARNLIYASCGEGYIDVLERVNANEWTPKEKIPTVAGARTCLFVPEDKKLYLAVPHKGAQRAEIRVYSTAP